MATVLDAPVRSTATPPPPLSPDALYEVINGQPVEIPPMGAFECYVANLLSGALNLFARQHRLGVALVETLFDLGAGFSRRRPDVAFVSRQRWPHRQVPHDEAWSVVPDLAVEVVSKSNTAQLTLASPPSQPALSPPSAASA